MLRVLRSAFARLFSFSAMLTSLLVVALFFLFGGRNLFSDPDLWWHLRDAQYLLHSHAFLHADMYSFTVRGKPWIDSEWLSELPFYFAWRWLGPRGVFVLTVGLIEAVALGVCWLGWQRTRNIKPALLACCPFLLMISVSMGPRTVMFGWLCLIVEIYLLREFREGRDRLWLLPVLFAVWINLHGTWPIGLVYLFVFVACGTAPEAWGESLGSILLERWSPAQRSKLQWVLGLSVAALFVNPYGMHLVAFPFHMLFGHTLMIESVEEWQTLNFHALRGKLTFAIVAALLVFSMVRRRAWRLNELVFTLIAVLSAFTYTRLLVLAGIVLCPLLAVEFDGFEPYNAETDQPILNFAILAILATAIVANVPKRAALQKQIADSCPEKALAYAETAGLNGRMMNELNWGGYIELNRPEMPVFIDSRSELYEPWGLLQDYIDAATSKRPFEVLDRYQIRYVLFPKKERLAYLLARTPGWATIYQDDNAVLFERVAER